MIFTLLVVSLAVLILFSAFFSGSETALFSLSAMRVRSFSKDKSSRKKLVAKLLSEPKQLLVTLLIFNVGVNIGIQNVTSSIFGENSSLLLSVGIPLVLTLILGEAIPKSVAISHNTAIALKVAPLIAFMKWLIRPFRSFLSALGSFFSRLFFFFLKKEPNISLHELKAALKSSKERGVISRDEAKLIEGSLKIDELVVKELMQPRQGVLYYNIQDPIATLIRIFVDEECSQVPVVDKDFDNPIGIITADAFFLHRNHIHQSSELKRFLKKICFVPETLSGRNLLATFQAFNETIALAVDEYGQISGVVTKEDIFEVVIGQIEDKRDEKTLYTKQSEDVIISSGKLDLHTLEELFDVQLETSSNVVTVGGWLTEQMGQIPKSGTKYVTDELLFHILAATPARVSRIYIRRLKHPRKRPDSEEAD